MKIKKCKIDCFQKSCILLCMALFSCSQYDCVVPKGYQEALLFYWLMSKHTATDTIPWKIDPQTENRLREYAQIFTSARSADALSARFGDTYWFYADFR